MMDAKPYPVRETWTSSSMGKPVVKTKQRDRRKRPDDVFQYVDVSTVSSTSFKITGASPTLGSKAPSRARKVIETHDFMVATVRPPLKPIALVPPELNGGIASTGYCVLRCDQSKLAPRFLYSFLITDHFNAWMAGLERGASYPSVRDSNVTASWPPLSPLSEHKKIAHILSTVQRAIEMQERIIPTTTKLKKALMHKLFTKGLRNELQKQIEIGPIPQSRELIRCEQACETTSDGIVVKPKHYFVPNDFPALRSQNVRVDRMQMEPMVYISEDANDGPAAKSELRGGAVLIVRTGANFGMSCVLLTELDGCNCINLLFIRTNPARLNGSFLTYFVSSVEANMQIGAGKTVKAQLHFNVGRVERIFVPLPPLEEQEVIVSCRENIDQKHGSAQAEQKALQDLFRALLYELMTAKTRVHEMELSV